MKIDIIAIGAVKRSPYAALQEEFAKRITWKLTIHEREGRSPEEEQRLIESKIKPGGYLIMLDERGKTMSSPDFAQYFAKLQNESRSPVQFVIGGAQGLGDSLRSRADLLLSFGKQTWPHMLARIMVLEQIYRAQTILSGHPYHKA